MDNVSIRVVHLSDIHLKYSDLSSFNENVVDPLCADLIKQSEKKKIDIICLTGDLLDKGGLGFVDANDGFEKFRDCFLEKIISKTGVERFSFFMAPGNHDVCRALDTQLVENGLVTTLINEAEVENYTQRINTTEYEGVKRVIPYKKFEHDFYRDYPEENEQTFFESTFLKSVKGIKVGVACINSSWRCHSDNDYSKLIIGESSIRTSLNFMDKADLRIMLSHHSTQFLCDFERSVLDDLITEKFQIALYGHNHSPDSYSKSKVMGTVFTSVGRCNWTANLKETNTDFINGYSILDIDLGRRQIEYIPRVFSRKRTEYVKDTMIVGDSESCIFSMGSSESQISTLHQINRRICDTFCQDMDQDLIMYGTDTKAPCSLKEIFVEPNIVVKESDEPGGQEININLEELCREKKNYAMIGVKEVGKTVLLDRIVTYYLENINELRIVPIHIKYDNYKHSRLATAISIFSGVAITEIDSFLKSTRVVILIDNMQFSNSNIHFVSELKELYQKYSNVSFILAITASVAGVIPIEYLDSLLYEDFKILYVKYYKVKQIVELTEKWYSKIEFPNKKEAKEKKEKIVKLLMALELPRTPLAISMFLWILEKQEAYQPINQSTMLENFIERLFKKHSKTEVFYDGFDYVNKTKLITAIARKMLETDRNGYSLKYTEIIEFTSSYFKLRKFEFDAEKIILSFIDIGLFVKYTEEYEPYVRFRFNCFFQYYLMKNMDNEDFIEFVLDEKHYLSFYDEIVLFTGLKRDRIDILKKLIERLSEAYSELSSQIEKIDDKHDSFFEIENSFAEQLDRGFLACIGDKREEVKKELEIIEDKMLESTMPSEAVKKKQYQITPFQKLERIWTLAAKVLRNTEETEEGKLKKEALGAVIKASMSFACLYKYLFIQHLRDKKDKIGDEEKEDARLIVNFMPLLHQVLVYDCLASSKLHVVLREYIEEILRDKSATQFEKYLAVFTFSDGKGKDYLDYIKKYIKQIKGKYMFDMTLFKLISYYFLRSETKISDSEYENLISEIIVAVQGKPKRMKSHVIQSYRKKRKSYKDSQTTFDFN